MAHSRHSSADLQALSITPFKMQGREKDHLPHKMPADMVFSSNGPIPTRQTSTSSNGPPTNHPRTKRSTTLGSIEALNIHSIDSVKFNQNHKDFKQYRSAIGDSDKNRDQTQTQNEYDNECAIDDIGYFSPLNDISSRIRRATTGSQVPINPNFTVERKISAQSVASINPESPTWVFSDLLSSISSVKDKEGHQILAKGNDLVTLLTTYPELKKDIVLKSFINKIQYMFYHPVTEVRSMGYRLVRHIISGYESLAMLIQFKILIFIIITMSSSRSSLLEKEQALKLIRSFLTIDKGADNLSIGVVKSIIALIESKNDPYPIELFQQQQQQPQQLESQHAKQGDQDSYVVPDSFRNLCVETICELALLKPGLLFHAGGFKLIVDLLIDGPVEVALCCFSVISKILDSQESRKFLRSGYDLISLVSIFTSDFESSEKENADPIQQRNKKQPPPSTFQLQKISFMLTILLKNFNGLFAFSIGNFKILSDLFAGISKSNSTIRGYLMDILFDILLIRPLPWLASSPIGQFLQKFNQGQGDAASQEFKHTNDLTEFERGITGHYRGLLALILIEKVGIYSLLLGVIEQRPSPQIVEKATHLITSIHSLACSNLPSEILSKKTLVMSDISTFVIDKYSRVKFKASHQYNKNLKSKVRNLITTSRYNVDDAVFKSMVANTKVLAIKEFEDWNWSLLLNLIQGPFSNPKRFDEILEKNPKFLKRIISFYRPFKFRFCNVSIKSRNANKYINIGCQLFELLLKLEGGVQYLLNNKLLPQLSEIFAQIDPYSGIESKDPILAGRRLESTISIGYVKFIGVFASNPAGLQILERWQFIQMFNNIIDVSMQSDTHNRLIITLLKNIDFSIDTPFRILFLKCLRVGNRKIRTFIVREILPEMIKMKELESLMVKILVQNLYDSDAEIVDSSIDLLHEFYSVSEFHNMEALLDANPPIQILAGSRKGKGLLYSLLEVSHGFKYLEDSGFIEEEFETILRLEREYMYVEKIEDVIRAILLPHNPQRKPQDIGDSLDSIIFLKHLLSSEEGFNYMNNLERRGFVDSLVSSLDELAHVLQLEYDSEINAKLISKMKQNLWLVGVIAQGSFGLQLLDPFYQRVSGKSIISKIIELFQTCTIWQIRAVCFYVIGMISTTTEGIEILDESDWVTVFDTYNNSLSLAYPRADISLSFNIELTNPYDDLKYYSFFGNTTPNGYLYEQNRSLEELHSGASDLLDEQGGEIILPRRIMSSQGDRNSVSGDLNSQLFERVLSLLSEMNSILNRIEKRAYRELIKIKRFYPEIFSNLDLFLEVIKVIDKGNFRFHKREFIINMFLDTKVLEMLVKRDRKLSFKY